MLATIHTSAINGLAAMPVLLEINSRMMHSQEAGSIFMMVGLPDNAVKESKLRVESALQSSGISLPDRIYYLFHQLCTS